MRQNIIEAKSLSSKAVKRLRCIHIGRAGRITIKASPKVFGPFSEVSSLDDDQSAPRELLWGSENAAS